MQGGEKITFSLFVPSSFIDGIHVFKHERLCYYSEGNSRNKNIFFVL